MNSQQLQQVSINQVQNLVKPVNLISQISSAIPGLAIPGVYDSKQVLPSINLQRKSLNFQLPQNYHSYKSQSESPFQARKQSSNHKSLIANNNQVRLDKIDENTEAGGAETRKVRVNIEAQRQNRSISPRINDKVQLKNTLNTSNKPNLNKPLKIQQTNEQQNLRNPPLLSVKLTQRDFQNDGDIKIL